jgi:hypothetical protein
MSDGMLCGMSEVYSPPQHFDLKSFRPPIDLRHRGKIVGRTMFGKVSAGHFGAGVVYSLNAGFPQQ